MPIRLATLAAAAAISLSASFAMAQTAAQKPAAAPAAAAPAPAAPAAKPARSAKSLECSQQADAKGLHGKARKKFRSDCMKGKAAG